MEKVGVILYFYGLMNDEKCMPFEFNVFPFKVFFGTIVTILELTILQISQSLYFAIMISITGSNWK